MQIERKLQHGWTMENFMEELHCSTEEQLFEVLRKDFSRKTVNTYISRMKKNQEKKRPIKKVHNTKMDQILKSLDDELEKIQVSVPKSSDSSVTIKKEEKKGALDRLIEKAVDFLIRKRK